MAAIIVDEFDWVDQQTQPPTVRLFHPKGLAAGITQLTFVNTEFAEITYSLITGVEEMSKGKKDHFASITLPFAVLLFIIVAGGWTLHSSLSSSIEKQRLEIKDDLQRITQLLESRFDKSDQKFDAISHKLDKISNRLNDEVTSLRIRQAQLERSR